MDYHAAEAGSWRQTVDATGSRFTRLTAAEAAESKPTAAIYGTASEMALLMYKRIPAGSLRMEGDADPAPAAAGLGLRPTSKWIT
ncbi:hypothetical protein [Nonomuraea aridisoli]|uniref:hypothetical protein n=1 Tax=Nonomuraea aridisoli TaxID=2070368 RepID=UPI001F30F1D0|nr:hypothetical protein [Nonomuraea aridisoli]